MNITNITVPLFTNIETFEPFILINGEAVYIEKVQDNKALMTESEFDKWIADEYDENIRNIIASTDWSAVKFESAEVVSEDAAKELENDPNWKHASIKILNR